MKKTPPHAGLIVRAWAHMQFSWDGPESAMFRSSALCQAFSQGIVYLLHVSQPSCPFRLDSDNKHLLKARTWQLNVQFSTGFRSSFINHKKCKCSDCLFIYYSKAKKYAPNYTQKYWLGTNCNQMFDVISLDPLVLLRDVGKKRSSIGFTVWQISYLQKFMKQASSTNIPMQLCNSFAIPVQMHQRSLSTSDQLKLDEGGRKSHSKIQNPGDPPPKVYQSRARLQFFWDALQTCQRARGRRSKSAARAWPRPRVVFQRLN